MSQIVKGADCGLLLDINNIYVSSVNHGFDPKEFIDAIDPQFVGQIHLAGHSAAGNLLIATHDEPVCKEVWTLYQYSLSKMGLISVMIERDAKIPEWIELEKELRQVQEFRKNTVKKSPENVRRRTDGKETSRKQKSSVYSATY